VKYRVAVTGLGVISPVGASPPDFYDSLVFGRSGIRTLPGSDNVAAGVVAFEADDHFSKLELAALDRFSQFALVAAAQAVTDAGLEREDLTMPRVGVYFGSGIGGASAIEAGYAGFFKDDLRRVPPSSVVATMSNAAAAHISIKFGIRGPVVNYSVACASSAIAIGEAFRCVRDGYLDIAIAGGSESILNPGSIAAWSAMKVLAKRDPAHPEASCKPFSKDRSGLVLGEGAGVIVIERLEHAVARGHRIHAELSGYGIASDAKNITKPSRSGQVAALQDALRDSGLSPADIDYLNAHGTATLIGDVVETEAIKEVFGAGAYGLPVSSTKALHGHLMGAAGAVEFIASLMSIANRTILPTCHYSAKDPECDLDYVPNVARRDTDVEAVMSSSFAFGGSNAVLVAQRF
jgi:3-oxoacyl-(acyl-carrier-protein) synthase